MNLVLTDYQEFLKEGKAHYILLDFMNYQHRGNLRNLNLVVAFDIYSMFQRVEIKILRVAPIGN